MKLNYRIAQESDLEKIYNYSLDQLKLTVTDEMELMMQVWESRFRQEALNHYLKIGWSFLAEDLETQKILGYFIGQPFLFFESQTQTLWVETFMANSLEIKTELCEIAIKLSRDKHFQRVILPREAQNLKYSKEYQFNQFNDQSVWVKTTK